MHNRSMSQELYQYDTVDDSIHMMNYQYVLHDSVTYLGFMLTKFFPIESFFMRLFFANFVMILIAELFKSETLC